MCVCVCVVTLHIQRRVLHTIAGTCLRYSSVALVTTNHQPLHETTRLGSNPNTSPHTVTQWADARAAGKGTHHNTPNLPSTLKHHLFRVPVSDQNHFLLHSAYDSMEILGGIQHAGKNWSLFADTAMYTHVDALQGLRLHLLIQAYGTIHL